MRILGVDFAATTGFCILESGKDRYPTFLRSVKFPSGPMNEGKRYFEFGYYLESLLFEVDAVVFEEPGFFRGRSASQQNSGYRAILMSACEKRVKPYASVPVTTLKKYMGVDSKEAMVETVKAMILNDQEVEDDNAADAYALAHYGLLEMEFGE